MTGLERVKAALGGSPSDLVPATATLSLYGARLTSCPLAEYYNVSERYVEGQQAIAAAFDPDILFTPFLAAAETEIFGGRARYFPRAAPNMVSPGCSGAAEFVERGLPDLKGDPRIAYLRRATRGLAERSEGRAVAAVFYSPMDIPPLAMGIEVWLETLLFHEELALEVISLATEYFIERSGFFFEDGADVLALPLVFCNPLIVTKWVAEHIAAPALAKAFAAAGGPIILHHGGSPINEIVAAFRGLPAVVGLVIDAKDSFSSTRRELGDEIVLLGNIDGPTLATRTSGSCAELRELILKDRAGDPRFILASSAADVAWETPPQNIAAFLGRPMAGAETGEPR